MRTITDKNFLMIATKAFAAPDASNPLGPFDFHRREPGDHDVVIQILYCGVCHSDVHQVRNEWGNSIFPMVPGHEIVGRISAVGPHVKHFKIGELAGVGCFVDSCRVCAACKAGLEQYCEQGMTGTYNALERDGKTPTYGGYSNQIVVDEQYTLHISDKLPLEGVAPLLCAGITTYSPLREWKVGKGHRLGVLGLGGLGHMAVKLGASLGAEVTMLSSSKSKETDAKRLGAHQFALTSDEQGMAKYKEYFDFIIDTVSAPHHLPFYMQLLKRDGTIILLGAPPSPHELIGFDLLLKRRRVAGSLIGGIKETQEMLDYCAKHGIVSDVEVIPIQTVNTAYERLMKGDVRYRFVIDMATL
jgi:alcohol dehydrogenase (NADP+)